MQQILPGHFAGPVGGNGDDIRRAFEVLGENVEVEFEVVGDIDPKKTPVK